eukprot:281456-Rhodomonas_salina.1
MADARQIRQQLRPTSRRSPNIASSDAPPWLPPLLSAPRHSSDRVMTTFGCVCTDPGRRESALAVDDAQQLQRLDELVRRSVLAVCVAVSPVLVVVASTAVDWQRRGAGRI